MSYLSRGLRGICAVLVGISLLAAVGCSKSDDKKQDDTAAPSAPETLYQNDMKDLAGLSSYGPAKYDAENGGIFSKIFGGTSASAISQYFSDRVKTVIMPNELKTTYMNPGKFSNERWLEEPSNTTTPENGDDSSGGPTVGALNYGTLWWLEGLVNNVVVTIYYHNNPIVVDSSRVGIVILGPGYTDRITFNDKKGTSVPAAFRESILMHEARHSDCTGGLSQDQLTGMRNATDAETYDAQFPSRACGHLHIVCPSSMGDLAGLAACDAEKWGAYTVGSIYAAAMIDNYTNETDKEVIDAIALDSGTRFKGVDDGSPPDMSSAGVLNP